MLGASTAQLLGIPRILAGTAGAGLAVSGCHVTGTSTLAVNGAGSWNLGVLVGFPGAVCTPEL